MRERLRVSKVRAQGGLRTFFAVKYQSDTDSD